MWKRGCQTADLMTNWGLGPGDWRLPSPAPGPRPQAPGPRPSPQRPAPSLRQVSQIMFSVTKRIDFCYGHRLLDYDGICKHPHGHNAVAEIEVRTETLDKRNMVVDFTDIKQRIKSWIDRELD